MKLRIVLLILAIIFGAVAVVGVMGYIDSIKTSVEEGVEKVEVLVAAQNIPKEIPIETLITENMVETSGVPRKYLAEGVLTSLDEYGGYVVAVPINKGEQITTTKFIRPEEIGLAFVIPEGMVAVSIPVNEIIGVSNLINIGDSVNIIATFLPEEKETASTVESVPVEEGESESIEAITAESEGASIRVEKETTKILLWNVEVLYIGTRIISSSETGENGEIMGIQTEAETRSTEITTVTLAVSPEDSEKLVFTEETGSVWLALVPTDGIEEEKTPGRTIDNIFER